MKRRASKLDGWEEKLTEWLGTERLRLADAQKRLAEQGCAVSLGRLSQWWEARQRERMRERLMGSIATGAKLNADLDAAFAKSPAPGMERIAELLKVLTLQLAVQGGTDPEMLGMVPALLRPVVDHMKVEQRDREIELAQEKFAFLKAKAEQAEKTEAVLGDTGLTDEQRRQRIAEIYGRA